MAQSVSQILTTGFHTTHLLASPAILTISTLILSSFKTYFIAGSTAFNFHIISRDVPTRGTCIRPIYKMKCQEVGKKTKKTMAA